MSRKLLIGICAFSLALNVAVAATVGLHLISGHPGPFPSFKPDSSVEHEIMREVRSKWVSLPREVFREKRRLVLEKNAQVVDLVVDNADKPELADRAVEELIVLRGDLEREVLKRMVTILASLPEDKRKVFAERLKRSRACFDPGMVMGGKRKHRPPPCPADRPQ
ncbi:MAG: hypothetical protein V2B18_13140 [Pseudomonadota bacterium]